METPLTQVYFMERCNACGRSYPLHLHGIHERQHLDEEWQSARPCESCITQQERLVSAVPAPELTAFALAWQRLATALEARGLEYHVGTPPPTGSGRAAMPRRSPA
jgi:hypothetical protein